MNKLIYTDELQGVLTYMVDFLSNEFPSKRITVEHMILALLEDKSTHANAILDNCLMSNVMHGLKEIYFEHLKNESSKYKLSPQDNKIFDEEILNLLEVVKLEKEKTHSKLIGSEHIMLALINPDNKFKRVVDTFSNVGLKYNFLLNKCSENENNKKTKVKTKRNQNMNPLIGNLMFPLKGEVNKKNVSTKGNFVEQYTTNLTQKAKKGLIDPLIGREEELSTIINTFARRRKNNVVLVGKGGCGKTAIVNGLANMIAQKKVPFFLLDKEIVQLNPMSLIGGTHFRGMFEERVNGLFEELKTNKKYILFIDDMQSVLKNKDKDKDSDLSSLIGDILSGNEVQVICTINNKEYHNVIENNTSLSRKFQKIVIEPTSIQDTIEIIKKSRDVYEDFHKVSFSDEVVEECVKLSNRYISDRCLPDSAFDVIDLAGAKTCFQRKEPDDIIFARQRLTEIEEDRSDAVNNGDFEAVDKYSQEENALKLLISEYNRSRKEDEYVIINEDDIKFIISDITKIPISKLSSSEKNQLANINNVLKASVIGQDEAIDSICKIIKRNKVGLGNKSKTLGSLLLIGQSGVGKCVTKETKIKIRNKKTSEIQELTIEDFIKLTNKT